MKRSAKDLEKKWKKKTRKKNVCYIWKKGFSIDNEKYYKVKYHFHYTGKHKAAAHHIYNWRPKIPKEVSVFFHNVSK